MDFAMAMHVLLLKNTKGIFPIKGFRLEVYLREFTRHCVILVLFSVSVQSEREVVRTINTRQNILQMVQRSPRLSTRRMASRIDYHVCRCGELYMRKICILTMIKGYIFNQATMLSVWISATG